MRQRQIAEMEQDMERYRLLRESAIRRLANVGVEWKDGQWQWPSNPVVMPGGSQLTAELLDSLNRAALRDAAAWEDSETGDTDG